MSWDTQKIESLRKLWDDGVATSQIGQQLGFTKNAVIGKAFRLGLERRQNSRKKSPTNNNLSSTIYRESKPNISSLANDGVKAQPPRRREKFALKKSIIGTGSFNKCQWPIGDPLKEGFHFCEANNIPTKPYCVDHYKEAYNVDEKYLDRLLDFLNDKSKN